MALNLTVESFLKVVHQSKLIERNHLSDLMQRFQQQGVDMSSPRAIAAACVEARAITIWQAENLLKGKHRGFFLGKYRLLELLGKGGMSSVFLAEHVLMCRQCAIKVLPANRVTDSSYLERFHREGQAVAALDHPNIVRAYDVDIEREKKGNDIHFLVMEYVDGRSLHEIVMADGVFSYVDAAEYICQAAEGLEHAHQAGLVHRDIKPANLLIDRHGVIKILDLGLVRFFDVKDESPLTRTHNERVLGTADYLAPEQAVDSHSVDTRADIYSLGCTCYFLLTGHPPFTEGTLTQRLMCHQTTHPTSITEDRRDIPATLLAIVERMMEKQPENRYQTSVAVATDLKNWLMENASEEWKTKSHVLTAADVAALGQDIGTKTSTDATVVLSADELPAEMHILSPTSSADDASLTADKESSTSIQPNDEDLSAFLSNLESPDPEPLSETPVAIRLPQQAPATRAAGDLDDRQFGAPIVDRGDGNDVRDLPVDVEVDVPQAIPVVPPVDESATFFTSDTRPEPPHSAEPTTPRISNGPEAASDDSAPIIEFDSGTIDAEAATICTAVPAPERSAPEFSASQDNPSAASEFAAGQGKTMRMTVEPSPQEEAALLATQLPPAFPESASRTRRSKRKRPTRVLVGFVALLLVASFGYGIYAWTNSDSVSAKMQSPDNDTIVQESIDGPSPDETERRFPGGQTQFTVGLSGDFPTITEAVSYVKRYRSDYDSVSRRSRILFDVAAGQTYNEAIIIDNSDGLSYPRGIRLTVKGDQKAILMPTGSGPAVKLDGLEFFEMDGFEIQAQGKGTAIELTGYHKATELRRIKVTGFTNVGVLLNDLSGLNKDECVLEQIELRADDPNAVGFKISGQMASRLKILKSRCLSDMLAGILVTAEDAVHIQIRECILAGCGDGLRFEGKDHRLSNFLIANNTFFDVNRGIVFTHMPRTNSEEIAFYRNAFSQISGPEAVIQSGFDEANFDAFLSTNGGGLDKNFSDRPAPQNLAQGEKRIILNPNQVSHRVQELSFRSTDSDDAQFLAPGPDSPLRRVGSPRRRLGLQPYAGAVAP